LEVLLGSFEAMFEAEATLLVNSGLDILCFFHQKSPESALKYKILVYIDKNMETEKSKSLL
jgi:hypothetical protein